MKPKWLTKYPLSFNYFVLAGSPEPKKVGFRDLVTIAYGPVSKNLAAKRFSVLPCKVLAGYKSMSPILPCTPKVPAMQS